MSLARKHHKALDKFEDTSMLDEVRQVYLTRAKKEEYDVVNTDDIIEIVQAKIQEIVLEKLKEMGFQIKN